jgi:hypothetical protein
MNTELNTSVVGSENGNGDGDAADNGDVAEPSPAIAPSTPTSAPQPVPMTAQSSSTEIIPATIRALETVYLAAMLEEVSLFDVVDRLVALFGQGALSLGPGRAGAILYRYWRKSCDRLTAAERNAVYAKAFGLPCDDAEVKANAKFNDLWVQFVSIVGMYSAELQVLPPSERSVGPAEILTIGRDLAINLSAHGRGLAWFAAHDLKPEIPQIIDLLSDPELQAVFGASDPWHLVGQVALSEFGVRPNVLRGRMRGESGVIIIRWLSNRRTRLLRPRTANILRDEDICENRTAASLNKRVAVYPTDSDLVTSCEQWLAVTGTQEVLLKEGVEAEAPPPTVRAAVERAQAAAPNPVPPIEQSSQAA